MYIGAECSGWVDAGVYRVTVRTLAEPIRTLGAYVAAAFGAVDIVLQDRRGRTAAAPISSLVDPNRIPRYNEFVTLRPTSARRRSTL